MLPKSMVGTFELTISVMVPHPGNVLAGNPGIGNRLVSRKIWKLQL